MLHHGKHAPVPTILRPVAGSKFEMRSFCAYNFKISQFKHLLCYLCFIVNKILAHVIWKSFSFHFIQTSQHFLNSGCNRSLVHRPSVTPEVFCLSKEKRPQRKRRTVKRKKILAPHLAIFHFQESMFIRAVSSVKLLSRVIISTLIRHYSRPHCISIEEQSQQLHTQQLRHAFHLYKSNLLRKHVC